MKRNLIFACLAFLATVVTTASFADAPPSKAVAVKTGVYGVCEAENGNWQLRLTLNDDGSFSYNDRTDRTKPLEVTGTWKQKGNTVLLDYTDASQAVIKKWKVNKNGTCLKTREKMLFLRLCNC